MKYLIFVYFLLACLCSDVWSQSSRVIDTCTMKSEILGGDRKYAVYLPPGYDTSARSYPVLYLLHGGGDDQTGWVQFGEVQLIAAQFKWHGPGATWPLRGVTCPLAGKVAT